MAGFYIACFLVALLHIIFGVLLTKEIYWWPKLSVMTKIILFMSLWFIPIVGAIIAYKAVKLDWLKGFGKSSRPSGNALLEMDSFFNPGAKHVIEAKQEVRMEMRKDEGKSKMDAEENKLNQ